MSQRLQHLIADPSGDESRLAFEDEAWILYLRIRGLHSIDGDVPGEPTREGCFWRTESGLYGVKQWNAAWWGWQEALRTQQPTNVG